MNATLEKPDGRTREARAARAAEEARKKAANTPKEPPLEEQDPYTKEWTEGFELAKAGKPLPEDSSVAMQEGAQAVQTPPAVPAQRRPRNPYAGYEVTRGVSEDDDPDIFDERKAPWREERPMAPRPAAVPAVFAQAPAPPMLPASSVSDAYHQRRARDIIRGAHERADKETVTARIFLEFPTSVTKREAFLSEFSEIEAPGPPAPTAYGDRDVAYMYWMADWHPEQFKEKYKTCAAPLARQLLREIEMR